jgi:hypothetical protein
VNDNTGSIYNDVGLAVGKSIQISHNTDPKGFRSRDVSVENGLTGLFLTPSNDGNNDGGKKSAIRGSQLEIGQNVAHGWE